MFDQPFFGRFALAGVLVSAILTDEPALDGIRNPEKQSVGALLNLNCAGEFALVNTAQEALPWAGLWPQVSHQRPWGRVVRRSQPLPLCDASATPRSRATRPGSRRFPAFASVFAARFRRN